MLWNVLQKEAGKIIHRLKRQGFGAVYIAFMENNERSTREFRERLASLIPIHVRRMNPKIFTRCFDLTLKQGLMSEYLFDQHFFMMIWKRNHWYGPNNYPTIIKGLLQHEYTVSFIFHFSTE